MTQNNLYLVEVTNNGRTTEGEYRVALPDGRVQVEIFWSLSLFHFKCPLFRECVIRRSLFNGLFIPQIVAYYADDDGFHAKVCVRLFADKKDSS